MATSVAMSPDILITIKLQIGSENRRFKLPLKDLGANILPDKVRPGFYSALWKMRHSVIDCKNSDNVP